MTAEAKSNGFFVAYRTQWFLDLLEHDQKAFRLLALIAFRARWNPQGFDPNGLQPGQALIGDCGACALTPGEYRQALARLRDRYGLIATETTNRGTVATLLDTRVFGVTAPTTTSTENAETETGAQDTDATGEPTTSQTATQQRASNEPAATKNKGKQGNQGKQRGPQGGPPQGKRFQRPTVEHVAAYCQERGNAVDPVRFWNYYEAIGWKTGRNPIRDWKATVRYWESRERADPRRSTPPALEFVTDEP